MKPKRLPLSGSEPKFKYNPWLKKGVRSNNCYAYAVGDYKTYRLQKSTPGNRSGLSNMYHPYTHCKGLAKRVISDNPGKVYKCKASGKCKPGFYKIMMVVAPNGGDFHFYKQHANVEYRVKEGDTQKSISEFFKIPVYRIRQAGPLKVGRLIKFKANLFSHKRGWATGPLFKDACGKVITDPRKACRKYSGLNYSKFCSAFCVKNRGINVGKTNSHIIEKLPKRV